MRVGILTALLASGAARAEDGPPLQLAPPALIQPDEGGGDGSTASHQPSFISGRTVGSGTDAIWAQVAWPGLSVQYLHGQSPTLDLGGMFTFNYGFEGTTSISPGIKMQGIARLTLMDHGKVNLGLRFDPGIAMYFGGSNDYLYNSAFVFGICMPAAMELGVSVGDAVMLAFGFDMPMAIFIVPDLGLAYFSMPILMGGGVEYHIDNHLSVTFDARFGPDIFISDNSFTRFAFRMLIGVGYKF